MDAEDEVQLTLDISGVPPSEIVDANALFGIDDELLHHVVALTLARVGIFQPVEVSLLFGDDETVRTLNRDYRGLDEATNVLSFPQLDTPLVSAPAEQLWQPPAGEPPARITPSSAAQQNIVSILMEDFDANEIGLEEPGAEAENEDDWLDGNVMPLLLGDVALSRQAIARQAAQAGHRAAWELAYLLVHGVLHLVGYDDQTDAGYAAMVAHQEAVLAAAGIAR